MTQDEIPTLDAYGHLNWTVGNEEWIACCDAIRKGDVIAYHVVVDCQSGGFVDTLKAGEVPFADVDQLYSLPDYWADICRDHYIDSRQRSDQVGVRAVATTRKAWRQYLDVLVKIGPCSESAPCGCCSECLEPGPDPVRDGWVGSDGRP